MKTVAFLLIGILAWSSVVRADTILIDFAGETYGPPPVGGVAGGVGAQPPAELNYNVFDPPPTEAGDPDPTTQAGTFRFQSTGSEGYTGPVFIPTGTQATMIDNLIDTDGNPTGIGLDGIYTAGSVGISRDTYTGAPVGGFAPEALQDMIFVSNGTNGLTFVLNNLANDGTTYTLTFATVRDLGFDGRTYYTLNGDTENAQFVELDAANRAGTVTFADVLPDANGEIRVDFSDRDPVTETDFGAAYIAAMQIETSASPAVPGDFDGDGDVDGADFVVWQTNFPTQEGATLATGDADGDGDVDGADFVIWQTNFPFAPGSSASPVPEPNASMLALLSFGSGLFMRRALRGNRRINP